MSQFIHEGDDVFRGRALAPTFCLLAAIAAPALASEDAASDVAPAWSASSALSDGGYRSALSRGKLDFAMRFDAPVRSMRPGNGPIEPVAAYVAPLPTLSVGLRNVATGPTPAGALLDRATGASVQGQRESRVGLEWKPSPSRVFLNRGLGLRLDGDDRLTMRLKKGSLGLFMQTRF